MESNKGRARVAPIPRSTVRREMCFFVRNMFESYKNYSSNLTAGGSLQKENGARMHKDKAGQADPGGYPGLSYN